MISQAELISRIEGSIAAIGFLRDQVAVIGEICRVITDALQNGGCIYTCGNGGSAAQALHLAEELIGRYRSDRPAQRAVCLNADATALTCIANDFGYEKVFARQCDALLTANDVLVGLSTSGNSQNIVNAFAAAAEKRATIIGLLGKTGGACVERCDLSIIVPGGDSAHVQEAHQVLIHLICEAVEQAHVAASNAPA